MVAVAVAVATHGRMTGLIHAHRAQPDSSRFRYDGGRRGARSRSPGRGGGRDMRDEDQDTRCTPLHPGPFIQ